MRHLFARRLVALPPLVCAAIASASPDSRDRTEAPPPGDLFGVSVAASGDVDRDGVPDFAVGDPLRGGGSVWIVSMRRERVLHRFVGGTEHEDLGWSLHGPGDLDGDSVPDLVAVAAATNGLADSLRAWSGASGAVLWTTSAAVSSEVRGWGLRAQIDGVGDVDGDRRIDVAIGCPLDEVDGKAAGSVRIHSGRGGALLKRHRGEPGLEYGSSVAFADADGAHLLIASGIDQDSGRRVVDVHDLAGAATKRRLEMRGYGGAAYVSIAVRPGSPTELLVGHASAGRYESRIESFDLRDGSPLRKWTKRGTWTFAQTICVAGDSDGDGVREVFAAAPEGWSEVSALFLLGGRSDEVTWKFETEPWEASYLGVSACRIEDLDGDRVDDLLVGEASLCANGGGPAGSVRVLSGKDGRSIRILRRADVER